MVESPTTPTPTALTPAFRVPPPAFVLLLAAVASTGCSTRYLNEHYGSRGSTGSTSVNGTSVFSEMLADAGHRVRSVGALYPRVAKADVIVWFSQSYDAPSYDALVWLDDWLRYSDVSKTLVYISRDHEAGPHYWRATKPMAPAEQQAEFDARLTTSESRAVYLRSRAPIEAEGGDWFTLDRRTPTRQVKELTGPWADGVDPLKGRIEHRRYLTPVDSADTLLADGAGHPLVSQIVYGADAGNQTDDDSRILLVENGSFLLNAPLVNKEHRKLAGRLVERLGPPERDIVFLEAGADPSVLEEDPTTSPPTGFALFGVWPIGAALAQLAALGLVFAAARSPIFGVPRRLERESLTDFGRHVSALGRLLAATRDRAYAEAQLRAYFHTDRRE